jgi:hypothetical protein
MSESRNIMAANQKTRAPIGIRIYDVGTLAAKMGPVVKYYRLVAILAGGAIVLVVTALNTPHSYAKKFKNGTPRRVTPARL